MNRSSLHINRSYKQLLSCLVPEDDDDDNDVFVDDDWEMIAQVRSLCMCECTCMFVCIRVCVCVSLSQVRTVEPVSEFTAGWRPAKLYRSHADPKRACLYFGDNEYEGLIGPVKRYR